MFQYCLAVVEEEAELASTVGRRVAMRILSAQHGLLALDTEVKPYDRKMTDHNAVPTTVVADQLMSLTESCHIDIHTFLPHSYLAKLLAAREMIEQRGHCACVHDHYLNTRGIGYQRQVLAKLRSTRGADDSHAPWRRPVRTGQLTTTGAGQEATGSSRARLLCSLRSARSDK